MKILCLSDMIDPLVYSTSAKERFKDIDMVLCAGDLPMDYIDFVVSTLNKPTYFIFGNHNLNEFGFYHKEKTKSAAHPVRSTEYSTTDLSHYHGAEYAGFKLLKNKKHCLPHPKNGRPTPLLIGGISGSLRYNTGKCQYTDTEMFFKLLKLIPGLLWNKIRYGRYLDIFLTHATPRHVHDMEDPCHRGFKSFNWFLKRFNPTYMIHGHIHLYDSRIPRELMYEKTCVINAYGHYILEIENTPKEKQ